MCHYCCCEDYFSFLPTHIKCFWKSTTPSLVPSLCIIVARIFLLNILQDAKYLS
jgi:hypothetical protein